jgi:predicted dehydrogenase
MNWELYQDQPLRVGIVGANPERGWAKEAHVPALQKLPRIKLTSVATRSEKSARAAAEAFGAEHWHSDPFALVRSSEVDIVSVCVKVPDHREILLAALDAGKHLYCEWPLGRNLEEAEELAAAAGKAGVHVAIGLQARLSPAARRARQLVHDGAVGRPLSARIVSTSSVGGPQMSSVYAYLNDPQNGANLSTILGGHTLDLAIFVLGKITQIDALSAIHYPSVQLFDTNERVERRTADQLLFLSQHENGCIVSADVNGTAPADTPFIFEILGTEGRLSLIGGDPHGFQGGELRLQGDIPFSPPDQPVVATLPREATNVAEVYAQLSHDIRASTWTVPDFNHAVRLSRLIDAVALAANTGMRQQADDWPCLN